MPNFLGRLQTFLFGAAVGRAASDAITPILEPVKQQAWHDNPNRVLEAGTAAEAFAQGVISEDEAQFDAIRHGYSNNRFGVLWRLAQTVPGIGEARSLRRRQKGAERQITLEQLHHVYAKNQIEPQYWDGLDSLVRDILSPGEIAAAIHRGLVPDPNNLLQGEQPTPPFNVKAYPVYDRIDAEAEAMGHGFDLDRLGVLVGLQGLPMGVIEAAHAYWRKIITKGDYIRAFNESNNRNEWAEAVLEYSRQIPTARDFMENALRGYHDLAWAQEQAQRHGMTEDDTLVIYQNQGRPMNIRQITQALARGAKFHPEPGEIKDPYRASTVEGPLKPAYYELNEALKYVYTVPFWWRSLLTAGAITPAEAEQLLLYIGNEPKFAKQVTDHFAATAGGAAADPRVKSAQTSAIGALHKRWMTEQTDEQGVLNGLQQVDVTAANAQKILDYWIQERLFTEKPLTPANIKKAYKANDFPIDEAVARLVAQQWSAADAQTYLTT